MSIIQAIIASISSTGGGGGGGSVADFTIEWWQKVENNGQNSRPWSVGLYSTQSLAISYEGHSSDYFWLNNSPIGNTPRVHWGQGWEHMAYVRDNGVVRAYINGVQYFSITFNSPITDTVSPLYVGTGELGAGMYQGYITDLHIMKGVVKYPNGSTFTPPTSPVSSQAGSVFLLPVVDDGSKYFDTVGSRIPTQSGSVTWSADSPYTGSNGSLYFNSSSYLNYSNSTDWAMDVA